MSELDTSTCLDLAFPCQLAVWRGAAGAKMLE